MELWFLQELCCGSINRNKIYWKIRKDLTMKKQKKLRGLQRRKAISGYLFIMPFVLGFSMFMVKPFFQSLYMSFCNVEVDSGGFKNIFAGLSNYIRAFTVDPEFNQCW